MSLRDPRAAAWAPNTLPLRLKIRGITAIEVVERTQQEPEDLFKYEHLAVALRCSGIGGSPRRIWRPQVNRAQPRENTLRIRKDLRSFGLKVPEGETGHFGVTTGSARQMQSNRETLRQRGIFLPYFTAYAGLPPEGMLRFAYPSYQDLECRPSMGALASVMFALGDMVCLDRLGRLKMRHPL